MHGKCAKKYSTFGIGYDIRILVKGFDSFVVLVESDGKQQMIFKHAISTIVPPKPLELTPAAAAL